VTPAKLCPNALSICARYGSADGAPAVASANASPGPYGIAAGRRSWAAAALPADRCSACTLATLAGTTGAGARSAAASARRRSTSSTWIGTTRRVSSTRAPPVKRRRKVCLYVCTCALRTAHSARPIELQEEHIMDQPLTLYVCHGDDGGPSIHPCRRVQEALRAAGIDYEKVIAAHGHPIPFLRKGSREELREATGDTKLPALKLPDGTMLTHSRAILAWISRETSAPAT
jgi:hypothetical protein